MPVAMHHELFSMHSYICIFSSHLGTLEAQHKGRDVGAEPEDGVL